MIRQLDTQTSKIDDQQLRDRLIFADVIAAQFPCGERRKLWHRPVTELTGPPYQVTAVVVDVASRAEFKRLRKLVNRLKHQDG